MMKKFAMPTLVLTGLLAACGDDDTDPMMEPVEEVELITTVALTFTNTADANDVVTAMTVDLDADGPNDPVITQPGPLTAGSTYELTFDILNEAESPAEDVTEEIREEAEEHRVFVSFSDDSFISATATDVESDYENGNQEGDDLPVGLVWSVDATAAGSGTITATLRHLPPIGGTPQKTPTVGPTDGETDFLVTFDITVQ